MAAYSFTDVGASITGPGGSFSIGAGSGSAEEGITIDNVEEKNAPLVGADGTIMHSLRAGNLANITIRLLKTSPVNALLANLYNFQKSSSAFWGQNVINVNDVIRGDVEVLSQVAFRKPPPNTYAKDGGIMEWELVGNREMVLGAGIPDVNI
jgi:hypothetical protein